MDGLTATAGNDVGSGGGNVGVVDVEVLGVGHYRGLSFEGGGGGKGFGPVLLLELAALLLEERVHRHRPAREWS